MQSKQDRRLEVDKVIVNTITNDTSFNGTAYDELTGGSEAILLLQAHSVVLHVIDITELSV